MVSARLQLRAKCQVIVDLSIEDNVNRPVFIGHGLMPAGNIDDRETTMAETNVAVNIDAGIVWAAVRHDVAHSRQRDFINGTIQLPWDCNATNSTHHSSFSTELGMVNTLLRT